MVFLCLFSILAKVLSSVLDTVWWKRLCRYMASVDSFLDLWSQMWKPIYTVLLSPPSCLPLQDALSFRACILSVSQQTAMYPHRSAGTLGSFLCTGRYHYLRLWLWLVATLEPLSARWHHAEPYNKLLLTAWTSRYSRIVAVTRSVFQYGFLSSNKSHSSVASLWLDKLVPSWVSIFICVSGTR